MIPDNAPGFAKQASAAAVPAPAPAFAKQPSASAVSPAASASPAASRTDSTTSHYSAADFKFLKVLGKGSFGKVCV
jgi:hypothetical protein